MQFRVHYAISCSYDMLLTHGDLCGAMTIALDLNDESKILETFHLCDNVDQCVPATRLTQVDPESTNLWVENALITYNPRDRDAELSIRRKMRLQLIHLISADRVFLHFDKLFSEDDECAATFQKILRREHLSEFFIHVATDLDCLEPRSPDAIYRTDNRRSGGLDPLRSAVASSYVSGFVHAGCKNDLVLLGEGSQFIHKARGYGITAATAAIGLISLWDLVHCLEKIDKFQYSAEPLTRGGALLAIGINTTGVANECDPLLALVPEALQAPTIAERITAYTTLGYAYVGTARQEVAELLVPVLLDAEALGGLEASSQAALALGLVFVGTGNEDVSEALIQMLLERGQSADSIHVYNVAIALALLFLGKEESAAAVSDMLAAVPKPLGDFCTILLDACAYAGSGDILKVQEMVQTMVKKTSALYTDTETKDGDGKADAKADNKGDGMEGDGDGKGGDGKEGDGKGEGANVDVAMTDGEKKTEQGDASKGDMKDGDMKDGDMKDGEEKTVEGDMKEKTGEGDMDEEMESLMTNVNVRESFESALPGLAVLALPLLTLREEYGSDMLFRLYSHFVQFDGVFVKRAVAVALMIQSASAPRPFVIEMLSKLSHDSDADTALHAILALGVVGCGTNNAKIAELLRDLSTFYAVDPQALFLVKLAQGILYTGKGLLTITSLHSGRRLINKSSLAGLIAFAVQSLFTKDTLCTNK